MSLRLSHIHLFLFTGHLYTTFGMASIKEVSSEELNKRILTEVQEKLRAIENIEGLLEVASLASCFTQIMSNLDTILTYIIRPQPDQIEQVQQTVLNNLPYFVYYSNYGNLGSMSRVV